MKKIKTLKALNEYESYLIKKESAIKSLLSEDVKKLGSSMVPKSVGSIVEKTNFMQGLDMVAPLFKNKGLQSIFSTIGLIKFLPIGIKIFNLFFTKNR